MCGIAGIVDLGDRERIDVVALRRMAQSIVHRGPDDEGLYVEPGLGLASRRLSIVGLADGQQPLFNEDGSVVVVANGELFEYPEIRAELTAKGHVFRTSSDMEILAHLWEEYGEDFLQHVRGQFAFAIYDRRKQLLFLARDRAGICPLHWTRRQDTIYFGSEIKAVLASGQIERRPDPRGIDHIFTFFAMGTRRTAFEGIQSLLPGGFMRIQFRDSGRIADVREGTYWDLDFPDRGEEYNPSHDRAVDEFRDIFYSAVETRLRADVPVVAYLSGGVDSSMIAAAVTQIRGESIPTFTVQVDAEGLDETAPAMKMAQSIGSTPHVIPVRPSDVALAYPELIQAADSPVVEPSCAANLLLAEAVHQRGYRVALTGEGADELLAGYPWYKTSRLMHMLDTKRFKLSMAVRRAYLKIFRPDVPWSRAKRVLSMVGGSEAYIDLYGMMSMSRHIFYRPEMFERLDGFVAFEDLPMPLERIRRWHPLNKILYLGFKTMLGGLLLNHKGDRPAMHSSVETRFPFLDERVMEYCNSLHPSWKIRGLWKDKFLLRSAAEGLIPPEIAKRPKAIYRAPLCQSFFVDPPPFVDQLLSRESLAKSGYFQPEQVEHYRENYQRYRWATGRGITVEMGLTAVLATQLWHHTYMGGGLCDLPTWSMPEVDLSEPAHIRLPSGSVEVDPIDGASEVQTR